MQNISKVHAYFTPNTLSGSPTEQMQRVGQLMHSAGHNVALDGNISMRLDNGRILLTRSGSHKGFLQPHDCIEVDIDGQILSGAGSASSEFPMHAEIYRHSPSANAVIHAHAPYALACSIAGIDLAEQWLTVPTIPTTEYARPASLASAEVIRPFIAQHFWAILPRHGAVVWGANMWEAFCRLEALEHSARIVIAAHSANPNAQPIDADKVRDLTALWMR